MLLQPRHFFFKRKHRQRRIRLFKLNRAFLKFGSEGLQLLNATQLTSKHLFRLKLFLKRASRKSDYTKRFVWLHAFPHLPMTRKPSGTRMGKGKGKLENWCTNVYSGIIFTEFKNLRKGRSFYFMKQLTFKLGIKTKPINSINSKVNFPLKLSKSFFFKLKW